MKRSLLFFLSFFFLAQGSLFAQENVSEQAQELTIDQKINNVVSPVTEFVESVVFASFSIERNSVAIVQGPGQYTADLELEEGQVEIILANNDYTKKDNLSLEDGTAVTVSNRAPYEKAGGYVYAVTVDAEKHEALVKGTAVKDVLKIPFILIWLIAGAIFFTFYLKFINIRGFKHAINIVRGKYTKEDDPGEVTHFQALTAALSGTVGLGNIAGVAVAVSLGGPGATFWMIVAGLFGMTSKFVECSLAVKYRNVHADGSISGGPMYYLDKGMSEKGMGRIGKFLAGFFALMCIGGSFGGGNMFQVNQAAQQFVNISGGSGTFFADHTWVFGAIMAGLVAIVILGGIKSIANVTEKIVPFMCGIYVVAAIIVLGVNYAEIPEAFGAIFTGAFSGKAIGGGFVGVLIQGVRRAAFSNEAGVGSAAIAHSAVKTNKPITEGFVASLEPFVDTVVVCTMTALVIVISGAYKIDGVDGIELTSTAFGTVIEWFPYILSIAVILFAFSTMISWSYYGLKSWTYLFGSSKLSENLYKLVFCIFVVIGASMSLDAVIGFSDSMIFAMAFPNIIGLYFLVPSVKKDLNNFLLFVKQGGEEEEIVEEELVEAE